jgi:hypothetical protein
MTWEGCVSLFARIKQRLTAPIRQEAPQESRDRQLRALGFAHLIRWSSRQGQSRR